jgi:hypothetical protein
MASQVSRGGVELNGEVRRTGAVSLTISRRDRLERSELVSLKLASWNQLDGWLRQVDSLRRAA